MRTYRIIILIGVVVVVILTAGLCYAPRFLVYSTNYAKVDAVIVLLGPDFSARQMHARDLIEKGMADYLMIPAYEKTYRIEHGKMQSLDNGNKKNNTNKKSKPAAPKYFEDTHLELMKAKETMTRHGWKSAIFVSSPYHMRRIRIIVEKEFDDLPESYFSPTPFESAPLNIWQLKASDWKKVWREYVKISWFILYSPWTR